MVNTTVQQQDVIKNETERDICKELEDICCIKGDLTKIATSFDDMNLREELARGICAYGFNRPSPIQSRAIIPIIEGSDLIAQAQSGTGKTATFVIGSLQRLEIEPNPPYKTQILALAPVRELAEQIFSVYTSIGQYMNVKCMTLFGGIDVKQGIATLTTEGVHVIVGTPGRVLHMINDGFLKCENIKILILDEADQMLDSCFVEQIKGIFVRLPRDVQVLLLSATMSEQVMTSTKTFMRNPVQLLVEKQRLPLDAIKQFYVVAQNVNNKVDAIIDIMGSCTVPQTVIFVNTQNDVLSLSNALKNENLNVETMHSGLSQEERNQAIKRFRAGSSKILVSTDLMARGIDVQSVSLVINFDLPRSHEVYIHRIGRSGRFGRQGVAINLILEGDLPKIHDIETSYKIQIRELTEDFVNYF